MQTTKSKNINGLGKVIISYDGFQDMDDEVIENPNFTVTCINIVHQSEIMSISENEVQRVLEEIKEANQHPKSKREPYSEEELRSFILSSIQDVIYNIVKVDLMKFHKFIDLKEIADKLEKEILNKAVLER